MASRIGNLSEGREVRYGARRARSSGVNEKGARPAPDPNAIGSGFSIRYDDGVIYTVGDCPVDPGDGIPYVISVTGQPPVLLYCPSCECAWASARDVELPPTRGLREFGLSEQVIRYATEAEVRAAGLELGETREPWRELPHPLQAAERSAPARGRAQRGFLAVLSEIDFHLVVLFVALAIPVLGFRLSPWLGVATGLIAPQGRVLFHASDRRRHGEPWLAYSVVNEAFVVAVVGAYALLR